MFVPTPVPVPTIDKILKVLELAVKYLPIVVDVIKSIAEAFGIKENDPEDLGDKAIQAEESGITPEEYSSYKEYADAVDDFKVDAGKSNEISKQDKQLRGTDILIAVLQEKCPDMDLEKLVESMGKSEENLQFFTPERFREVARLAADNPELINLLGKLLNGDEMKNSDYLIIVSELVKIEQKIHPESSVKECEDYVRTLG
jgi:hypothetical protein